MKTFPVTQAHIDAAILKPVHCPIRRAMVSAGHTNVYVGNHCYRTSTTGLEPGYMTQQASRFTHDFDAGRKVHPGIIEISEAGVLDYCPIL